MKACCVLATEQGPSSQTIHPAPSGGTQISMFCQERSPPSTQQCFQLSPLHFQGYWWQLMPGKCDRLGSFNEGSAQLLLQR